MTARLAAVRLRWKIALGVALSLVVLSSPSLIEKGDTFIPCNCGTVLLP